MGRAVELDQFALAGRAQTALAMSGRAAFAWRADAVGAEQPAQGFAAQREAFLFDELLVQVMVVEASVARACRARSGRACARAGGGGWAAAADVRQSRCAALPIARFEPFDMPRR